MTSEVTTRRVGWKRWRRWLWLPPVLAGIGWAAWHFSHPAPPPPPPTAAVEVADITHVVQAAGIVQARTKVDVGAQVTGQVRTLHVQLGQTVRKGELLVSLDPELARNDVQQAEAGLAQQEAMLESRRIDLAQARREAERQRKLMGGEATSRAEAEKAEADLAKLEADVRGQTAQVGKLRADLGSAKLRLGYTQILAPTDGDVVSIAVQEGQTVNAQQSSPTLLTLAQLDTVTIKAQVAEADVRHIRIDQEASFVTLGDAEQRHRGRVRLIQPIAEKVNNAMFYNVLFDVPNPRRPAVPPAAASAPASVAAAASAPAASAASAAGAPVASAAGTGAKAAVVTSPRTLMLDMSVQVELQIAKVAKALTIPMAALGDKGPDGRYAVQVQAADGKAATRQVRVGIGEAAKVQVLDGLTSGEKVLLAPPAAASGPTP